MLTRSLVFAYCMRGSVMPPHLVQADGPVETLQDGLALIRKVEALASGQLLHDVGRQYVPRLSLVTDPGCQLHSGAEQVLILGHWLTSVEADADTERSVGVGFVVVG